MSTNIDIIIIGSGPAGVSAAFPLLQAGLRVLMLDVGRQQQSHYIADNYLALRQQDKRQASWMLGDAFHALRMKSAVSPKLRIPALSYVFADYLEKNHIKNSDFTVVGSLAAGGLSNAWGAGVARFSAQELSHFPFPAQDITDSYATVSRRMGISGRSDDDLKAFFAVDGEASDAVPMDEIHQRLFNAYSNKRAGLNARGFHLGRSRVAVLTEDRELRKACSLSGNCLWGCSQGAIYSAVNDLQQLRLQPNFFYQSGFLAEQIVKDNDLWQVQGINTHTGEGARYSAGKVILAAGTLASTKLAAKALAITSPIAFLSSPTAAFLLWLPRLFGRPVTSGFGLGQLSFTLADKDISAFGSTFATSGIPLSEFASHLPLRRANSLAILNVLLSSCAVGNVFLPGHLTSAKMQLDANGELRVWGAFNEKVPEIMQEISSALRKHFLSLGGLILPGSFTLGRPGGDIHYAGSFPMRTLPSLGETSALGEVAGLANVFMVDGAVLPVLPEKSHTLTIMANADRIGRAIGLANQSRPPGNGI